MRRAQIRDDNRKMKTIRRLEIFFLTILIVSFCILLYCIYVSMTSDNIERFSDSQDQTIEAGINTGTSLQQEKDKNEIKKKLEELNQSIVGISKIKDKGSTIFLENCEEQLGLGSGFILSDQGYILTTFHIGGKKDSICYITLETGITYTGKVVWADSEIDASIIKIEASNLKPIELGDSDTIQLTQKVYALGNPIGFDFLRTVTAGNICGMGRTVQLLNKEKTIYLDDLIQTDTTISFQNSGGPLIDEEGKVIGLNTNTLLSGNNLNYVLPINRIKPVLKNLEEKQNATQTYLGVFAFDHDLISYIKQDLATNQMIRNGIYIATVDQKSPAAKAGLKEGDIILTIDQQSLNKMKELYQFLSSKQPGDKVEIAFLREGKEMKVEVEITSKM